MFVDSRTASGTTVHCRSGGLAAVTASLFLATAACTGQIGPGPEPRAPAGQPAPGVVGPPGTNGEAPPGPAVGMQALGPPALRRLTSTQYRNSVEDLLGPAAAAALKVKLEDDARLSGLTAIGASVTSPSPRATELHEQAAEQIVTAALADVSRRQALVGCDPAQPNCLEGFVERFGLRAWRRPLEL